MSVYVVLNTHAIELEVKDHFRSPFYLLVAGNRYKKMNVQYKNDNYYHFYERFDDTSIEKLEDWLK